MSKLFEKLCAIVVNYRLSVILLLVGGTIFLGMQAKNLKLVIDPNTIMPQNHPYVMATNLVDREFGSKFVIVIGLRPRTGDIDQPVVIDLVRRLTERLETTEGVVRADLLSFFARKVKDIRASHEALEVKPLIDKASSLPEQARSLRASLQRNPVYQGTIASVNGKMAAIYVEMKELPGGFRTMYNSIKTLVDAEANNEVEVLLGGNPVYLAHAEMFSDRIKWIFPLAALLIGILQFEAFRTFQGFLLPLATALLSVVWGLGFMGWAGVPLDVFNTPTIILILAVAAGHAVQLLKRYYEVYAELRNRNPTATDLREINRQAVIQSVGSVGPVMTVAGVVAALSFFSLSVFDISSIRVFGIFTGIGILSAIALELTLIPAVRSILKPPTTFEQGKEGKIRIWDRIPNTIAGLVLGPARRKVFIGAVILVLLAGTGAAMTRIDNSNKNYFASDLFFQVWDRELNSSLAGTNTMYVVVQGAGPDSIKSPGVLQGIDAIQQFAQSQSQVGKAVSIADFVKRMHQAMHRDNPEFYKVPDSQDLISQYLLLYSLSGEPQDFSSYVDYEYKTANITIFLKTASTAYGHDLINNIQEFAKSRLGNDVTIAIGGSVPQTTALTEVMVEGKIKNIIQIAVIISVLSMLLFRSVVAGLLVLIPVACTVLFNFGLMGWFGIKLNIPNSLSSAMAVGIGADYAIYFLYRLKEELAKGHELDFAIRSTYASAGKASLYVASAVAIGYGTMIFSPGFRVHNWYGVLMACAMVVSVMSTLLLVPALLKQWQPGFVMRRVI